MSVRATIYLSRKCEDQKKAEAFYAEVKSALEGKTECTMQARASNHEEKVEITK